MRNLLKKNIEELEIEKNNQDSNSIITKSELLLDFIREKLN